jgi:hypothetical protein
MFVVKGIKVDFGFTCWSAIDGSCWIDKSCLFVSLRRLHMRIKNLTSLWIIKKCLWSIFDMSVVKDIKVDFKFTCWSAIDRTCLVRKRCLCVSLRSLHLRIKDQQVCENYMSVFEGIKGYFRFNRWSEKYGTFFVHRSCLFEL